MKNDLKFLKGDKTAWTSPSAEDRAFRRSLARMSSILSGKPVDGGGSHDSGQLEKVLDRIGWNDGIDFKWVHHKADSWEEGVENICRDSHIRFRQVHLTEDWMKRPTMSLLAFLSASGQPVALIPDNHGRFQIYDPVSGTTRTLDPGRARNISRIAYSFFPPLVNSGRPLWGALQLCAHGQGRNILKLLAMGSAMGLLGLLLPFANKVIFDHVIPDRDFSLLWQILLGLTCAGAVSLVYLVVRDAILIRLRGLCEYRLQGALWDYVFRLPLGFFRKFSSGEVTQRIDNIEEIRDLLADSTLRSLLAGVFSLAYLGTMFYFSWQLSLIGLMVVAIASAVSVICAWLCLPLSRQILRIEGKVSETLIQLVDGIGKLRVAGAEKRVFAYWADRFTSGEQLQFRMGGLQNIAEVTHSVVPIVGLLAIYATAMLISPNPALVADSAGVMSTGDFLAFQAAFAPFALAISELAEVFILAATVLPHWERARVIFDHAPEKGDAKQSPGKLDGEIDVKNLFFRYDSDAPFTLYDVSLRAEPGEFIGIVGASGCGKSTLIRLLLGFESPEKGSLFYSRQDLSEIDLPEVRRQLGVVLQSSGVFAGSIYDNIVCGSRRSPDAIEEAIRTSTFDEVLKELPMGLDTVLPSGGGTLSGGQRQRLLIARALVGRPKILLFDEATSSLDNLTEMKVMRHLQQLRVTRIAVAHRLSTVRNANRIYVMDQGKFTDHGSFSELVARNPYFKSLADRQFIQPM